MSSHASPVLRFLRDVVSSVEAPDAELLRGFVRRRDEAAFAALVQRHGPTVLTACRRVLRNEHDAEDAFQATFLVLARKAGSVGRPELLGNWLYGVAFRVAMKARSEAARRRAKEAVARSKPFDDGPDAAAWSDVAPVLDEEVNRLPERYRLPFVLCHLQGKTNDEAARLLGCPKGTVLSRLSTAREKLRSRLVRRGVVLSAALVTAAPSLLMGSTVQAALAGAAGQSTAGLVPARAARWAEGVMRAMLLSKVKVVAVVLVVLVAVATGFGVMTHRGPEAVASDTTREPNPKEPPMAPPTEAAENTPQLIKNARVMDVLVDLDAEKGTITFVPGFKEEMFGYVGPIEERQKKLKDRVDAAGKKPKTARVAADAELRLVFRFSPSVANNVKMQLSEFEKCKYLFATLEVVETGDELIVKKMVVWR
jgi:RNA polymerase sigma factor (sigma-70 family)